MVITMSYSSTLDVDGGHHKVVSELGWGCRSLVDDEVIGVNLGSRVETTT